MREEKPIWCFCQPFKTLSPIWYQKLDKEGKSSDYSNMLLFYMCYFNSECNLYHFIGFKVFSCLGK